MRNTTPAIFAIEDGYGWVEKEEVGINVKKAAGNNWSDSSEGGSSEIQGVSTIVFGIMKTGV